MADEDQPALFDVEPSWAEHWKGMPEYGHQNLQPKETLLVHFRSKADRAAFSALIGQHLHERTKFIWWPRAEITKAADKVWARGEKVTPRYPVYIISKGRADTRLTSKSLEWLEVPYHIVVEPQEHAAYAAVIDPAKILTLPFSNLGLGGIPARNWVFEHAVATGAERHWILDDNISGFCRFNDNLKVEVDSGVTFCAVEDFCDRYENVAMAAFNYDYFAPRKQGAKIRPLTLNTRCYSGILLSNKILHRWRGRYNEDTDLSLRILKDGLCTVLFNAFLMYKKPTLTMKGGNTDELYAGAEAMAAEWETHAAACATCKQTTDGYDSRITPCEAGRVILSRDGRWLMAESLREQHPDCTTVERKWRRWQHQVDYRRFRNNELVLRADAVISEGTDDYGMTLGKMPEGWGAMTEDVPAGAGALPAMRTDPKVRLEPAGSAVAGPSILDFLAAVPSSSEPSLAEALAPPAEAPLRAAIEPGPPPSPVGALDFLGLPGSTTQPAPAPLTVEPTAVISPEAIALKSALASAGHRLLTRDGKFFVTSDAGPLTDAERVQIKQHRNALIALASPWVEHIEVGPAPLPSVDSWRPDEPPDLTGIDEIVLNFATDGLDWLKDNKPVGVTVSTLDGQLTRFLPFRFAGGNLDEDVVKRWAREQLRGKKITNAKMKFDVHMARVWGVDLEEQGCTFSDVQHTAALLDDHRKRFALDVLAADYFPNDPAVARVDEKQHHHYHASIVAERERYTVQLVSRLRDVMYPELKAQDLEEVQRLEDNVIPAVVEMEKNGASIDLDLLEVYRSECRAEYERLMWEISREAGFAFEHTAKGWARLLEHLGMTPLESYSEGQLNLVNHPLVRKGQLASQHASLLSKTFDAYAEKVQDGVLYYDINQLAGEEGGTVSGRFSIGYVQQVPNFDNHAAAFGDSWFPRRLFIPREGSYLEADARQIEYRLFAHYANNQKVLAAYQEDPLLSFHKMTWEMMKAYKVDMLYSHQKSYNFAKMYGARSIKLAVMMKFITEAEGEEIRQAKRWNDPRLTVTHEIEAAYKKMMPEGDLLLDRASHLAKPECDKYCRKSDALHRQYQHRGYVKTLVGRRSRFPNAYKTYIGLNRILQGTGADVMKIKLAELHAERKTTGFTMRMTVHDAVGGDARESETLSRVSDILNRQSFPQLKVPILWECGTGKTWADCK